MKSAVVRAAGLAVFLSTSLGLAGFIVLFFAAVDTANGSVLGNKSVRTALDQVLGATGWFLAAVVVLVFLFAYFFSLVALRGYLNRYAGYTRANAPIDGIVGCSASIIVVAAGGWAIGAGPLALIVLGILAVITFILYFVQGFRLKNYAKAAGDRPVRVYAILVLVYCCSMLATLFLAMVAAAHPPLMAVVAIVGWVNSLVQLAAWVTLGVVLIAGAKKLRRKELGLNAATH